MKKKGPYSLLKGTLISFLFCFFFENKYVYYRHESDDLDICPWEELILLIVFIVILL